MLSPFYHAGKCLIVPLSSNGTHFVGFPAAGAFNSVPAAAPAPFVNAVFVFIIVALLIVKAPAMFNPADDNDIIALPKVSTLHL
jgi:hypothetical protein